MQEVDITFVRAIKILWSWMWRAFVLTMPAALVMVLIFDFFNIVPKPGQRPEEMQKIFSGGKFFLVWIGTMTAFMSCYILAMRWMLKTKWSDFKLIAVPPDEQ